LTSGRLTAGRIVKGRTTMGYQMPAGGVVRGRGLVLRVAAVSAVVAAGLALSPVAAFATETLSATGSGWAVDQGTALASAKADAYGDLWDLAASRGGTCANVTYTTSAIA
jgi:hypothetical protein